MKANFLFIFVLVLNAAAFSKTSDLFPLSEIPINMSYEDFRAAYPDVKPRITRSKEGPTPADPTLNFFHMPIEKKRLWTKAMITTQLNKVQCLILVGKYDRELSKKNVTEVYEKLLGYFGKEPDRKIAFSTTSFSEQKKTPYYVWQRDGLLYTFSHTPLSDQRDDEDLVYTLNVSDKGLYKKLFPNLYDFDENDKQMFASLSGQTVQKAKASNPLRGGTIIGLLFVAGYFILEAGRKMISVNKR